MLIRTWNMAVWFDEQLDQSREILRQEMLAILLLAAAVAEQNCNQTMKKVAPDTIAYFISLIV